MGHQPGTAWSVALSIWTGMTCVLSAVLVKLVVVLALALVLVTEYLQKFFLP